MIRKLTILTFGLALSGCDVAINAGVNLGSQIVVERIDAAFRSNTQPDYPRSSGTNHLVCDPPEPGHMDGQYQIDPAVHCHTE